MFDQQEFIEFATRNKVYGLHDKPVPLSSGGTSRKYVDWRKVTDNILLGRELASYVVSFTEDLGRNPDCFLGVAEGATKLGFFTQLEYSGLALHATQSPMMRAKEKFHGPEVKSYFVGEPPRGDVVILEDVVRTGRSLNEAIAIVREYSSANVIAAVSLTDRGMNPKICVPYYPMISLDQLIEAQEITFS